MRSIKRIPEKGTEWYYHEEGVKPGVTLLQGTNSIRLEFSSEFLSPQEHLLAKNTIKKYHIFDSFHVSRFHPADSKVRTTL